MQTVKIMTSHRLQFENKEGAIFVSAGGNAVELAPAWIAENDMFRAGKAAGQLTELESQSKAPLPVQKADPVPVTFTPVSNPKTDEVTPADSTPATTEVEDKARRGGRQVKPKDAEKVAEANPKTDEATPADSTPATTEASTETTPAE